MKHFLLKSDGLKFKLVERDWEEYHGITAAIITLNEEEHILEYLRHVRPFVKRIVMIDGGSLDRTVEIAESYVDVLKVIPFAGHFGKQKNAAMDLVYTDWTLFLDPDERFSDETVAEIPSMIEQNEVDCYRFPRKEIIDGEENPAPYPDYQARLFRSYCRFIRPIHEELVGFKKSKELDKSGKYDIIHLKKESRHNERNVAYPFFGCHYIHEIGKPGEQTKDTVVIPENLLNKKKED